MHHKNAFQSFCVFVGNASSIHHPSNFRNEEEDQLVWNSDTNGRNDHLNHLTNIYSEVVQSPLMPGTFDVNGF